MMKLRNKSLSQQILTLLLTTTLGFGIITFASIQYMASLAQNKGESTMTVATLQLVSSSFILVFGLINSIISYSFSKRISGNLTNLSGKLSHSSNEVFQAALSISNSSTELSAATTEQNSAIQNTASSIDEVTAMVRKTAENASQSKEVSISSKEAAEQGQREVEAMLRAINEISTSNTSIMNQVSDGNKQINEIVKLISEIESKTKVINDIVFQTKLLSFNASVEAARAGEHGKGFAVVAEEVGNLAQMSGNAAKEISSLLEGSIRKVESIVASTQSKVETLIGENKSKVAAGTQLANRCSDALTKILSTVHGVNGMVEEISSANQEQSQGITEIGRAMNQLDAATQKNAEIALSASQSAQKLTDQASELRTLLGSLSEIIRGSGAEKQGTTTTQSSQSRVPLQAKRALHTTPSRPSIPSSKSAPTLIQSGSAKVIPLRPSSKTEETVPLARASGDGITPPSAEGLPGIPSKDDPRFEDV